MGGTGPLLLQKQTHQMLAILRDYASKESTYKITKKIKFLIHFSLFIFLKGKL